METAITIAQQLGAAIAQVMTKHVPGCSDELCVCNVEVTGEA